tara:strand:+ start:343 stop:729 length:387 start_codon:yes stop_codon:yes gene_type:complete
MDWITMTDEVTPVRGYFETGEMVAYNNRYVISDLKIGELMVSKTTLRSASFGPGETNGHTHDDQDEVYIFLWGHGTMQLDGLTQDVGVGDTVVIPAGVFHKVANTHNYMDLIFVAVWAGARSPASLGT